METSRINEKKEILAWPDRAGARHGKNAKKKKHPKRFLAARGMIPICRVSRWRGRLRDGGIGLVDMLVLGKTCQQRGKPEADRAGRHSHKRRKGDGYKPHGERRGAAGVKIKKGEKEFHRFSL